MTINETFNTISEEDLQRAEIVGLPIALIILIVVFGALVAALIPVGMALAAVAIATGLAAIIGTRFELSFFIVNMISVIGLAVGIDYALFVVERYREERKHGRSKLEAIEVAGGTATKAVVFSGLTVVFALIGLFLMPNSIFRSLGLGAILAVMVSVGAILTLIPALISLLGDRIDWPRRRNYDALDREQVIHEEEVAEQHGFWGRAAHLVMRRPWPALVLGAGLLIALSIPFFSMNTGFAGVESLPESDVKDAFVLLQEKFSAGRLAPVDFVVDAPKSSGGEAAASALAELLANEPGVATVGKVEWNDAGDLAHIQATLTTSADDEASYAVIRHLRNDAIPSSFPADLGRVLITGQTAGNLDFINTTNTWTPRVFVFVLGLSFLLADDRVPLDRGARHGNRYEPALGGRGLWGAGAGLSARTFDRVARVRSGAGDRSVDSNLSLLRALRVIDGLSGFPFESHSRVLRSDREEHGIGGAWCGIDGANHHRSGVDHGGCLLGIQHWTAGLPAAGRIRARGGSLAGRDHCPNDSGASSDAHSRKMELVPAVLAGMAARSANRRNTGTQQAANERAAQRS